MVMILIRDIFSKRQKRMRGEMPDVYQYKTIPQKLRVQIIYIIKEAFENLRERPQPVYELIHKILCEEYGVFTLDERYRILDNRYQDHAQAIFDFLLQTQETEKAIDVIEVSFGYIDSIARGRQRESAGHYLVPAGWQRESAAIAEWQRESAAIADAAIAKLNNRFREHGVGYQYESDQIIRVDSQLIHSEVVQPALSMLLSDPIYKGTNAEFLNAHEHYRKQRYKECLNDCLKAFESCLKAICDQRRWNYNKKKDTAKRLIAIVFDKKLIPQSMQSHFTGLRSMLESGVPPLRNHLAGHGQGSQVVSVPEFIAAYALHLTAANILLLARAHDETK